MSETNSPIQEDLEKVKTKEMSLEKFLNTYIPEDVREKQQTPEDEKKVAWTTFDKAYLAGALFSNYLVYDFVQDRKDKFIQGIKTADQLGQDFLMMFGKGRIMDQVKQITENLDVALNYNTDNLKSVDELIQMDQNTMDDYFTNLPVNLQSAYLVAVKKIQGGIKSHKAINDGLEQDTANFNKDLTSWETTAKKTMHDLEMAYSIAHDIQSDVYKKIPGANKLTDVMTALRTGLTLHELKDAREKQEAWLEKADEAWNSINKIVNQLDGRAKELKAQEASGNRLIDMIKNSTQEQLSEAKNWLKSAKEQYTKSSKQQQIMGEKMYKLDMIQTYLTETLSSKQEMLRGVSHGHYVLNQLLDGKLPEEHRMEKTKEVIEAGNQYEKPHTYLGMQDPATWLKVGEGALIGALIGGYVLLKNSKALAKTALGTACAPVVGTYKAGEFLVKGGAKIANGTAKGIKYVASKAGNRNEN